MRLGIINKITGKCGEDAAADFLKNKKYKIVKRNYKNKIGEIDIIAEDKDEIIFVEVKTRSSFEFGTPAQAVNYHKKRKIANTAEYYLMENPTEKNIRFDVIEVFAKMTGEIFELDEINHIEGAFFEI